MIKGPLLAGAARDLILDYLKANINTEIALADNMRTDGINVEPVDSDAFYISEAFLSKSPPAIYVLKDGAMRFLYDERPNWLQAEIPFMIVASVQDMGADVLEQKAESYSRILFKLLDQRDLQDGANRIRVHLVIESLETSDLMAKKLTEVGQEFRRDVILKIKALHYAARFTDT